MLVYIFKLTFRRLAFYLYLYDFREETNRRILSREIIATGCGDQTEPINALCGGQNVPYNCLHKSRYRYNWDLNCCDCM